MQNARDQSLTDVSGGDFNAWKQLMFILGLFLSMAGDFAKSVDSCRKSYSEEHKEVAKRNRRSESALSGLVRLRLTIRSHGA